MIGQAAQALNAEATPIDDHRATAAYRTAMLGASLRKFFVQNSGTTPDPARVFQEV